MDRDQLKCQAANGSGSVEMPENEYLIGQAAHHDPCLGRALNIRQLIVPWPSSVLSVLGLPTVDLSHLAFGVYYEALNRATLGLSSALGREGEVSHRGMAIWQKPKLISPVNIFSYVHI